MGATLRATRSAAIAGAIFVAAAAVASGIPGEQVLPSAAQGSATDLVDRFLELTDAVPEIDPEDVLVNDQTLEVDFLGDHIGDHARLEAVHDDAQMLFIDGEDAESVIGEVVADGARAVMLIEDGYRRLAEYETIVPFDSVDELGVAVGTDEPRHLRAQGIDLIQNGQYRLELVLVAMREFELTTEQTSEYQDAVRKALGFAVSVDPKLRELAGDRDSAELLSTTRFDPDIAGTAAARWVSYACVPVGSANALSAEALQVAVLVTLNLGQADDCPDLPDPETLDPNSIVDGSLVPAGQDDDEDVVLE